MGIIQGFVSLVGRLLLVTIFLAAGATNHIQNFAGITQAIKAKGIPMPEVAHVLAIACMLLGGVSVLVGFKARFGATLLLVFLGIATYYFHDFWHLEGKEAEQQMIHFMKNVAMMGAMVFIIANGAGAWSLDRCWSKTATPPQ